MNGEWCDMMSMTCVGGHACGMNHSDMMARVVTCTPGDVGCICDATEAAAMAAQGNANQDISALSDACLSCVGMCASSLPLATDKSPTHQITMLDRWFLVFSESCLCLQ